MEKFSADVYADALIADTEETFCKQLEEIISILHQHPKFFELLATPEISAEEKKKLLKDIFHDSISPHVSNLLFSLSSSDRLELLDSIYQEYQKRVNGRRAAPLSGKLFSAFELEDEKIREIEKRFEKYYNTKIHLSLEIDKDLIGGIVVTIGDKVFDGSIRSQLMQLKEYILNE